MGDEHNRSVEVHERLLEPLERLDVEMVRGLIEQQHIGTRRKRTGERSARELSAREGVQRTVEIRVAKAESVGHRGGAVAPQIATAALELGLGG